MRNNGVGRLKGSFLFLTLKGGILETKAETPGEFYRIRSIFLYAVVDNCLRNLIGIDKVSQIFDGEYGWYFWLSGRQGVWELCCADWGKKFAWPYCRFLLRYYPHPEEKVFENFSFGEQIMRLSPSFTDYGCPKFDSRGEIDESYYVVGKLDIFLRSKIIVAILKSQDRWIEYRPQGLKVEKPGGERVWVVEEGGKDRDVPGWDLSWQYFDCLVKAFCCIQKTPPSMVRLKSYPGRIWYVNGGEVWEERSAEALTRQLKVAIVPAGEKEKFTLGGETLFSQGQDINEVEQSSLLNKDWWEAAREGERLLPPGLCV